MFKASKRLTAAITLGLCLAAAPSAFALNEAGDTYGTGNKPINFSGYRFVDAANNGNDSLIINFDKNTASPAEITASMFTIKKVIDGSSVGISSLTRTSNDYDSGCDTANWIKGTKAVLALNADLADDALYEVTISGYLMDKNGITMGNYRNRKDFTFRFRTPDSEGNYSATVAPYVTYFVGDGTSNVSWESNLGVIFDRPIDPDSLTTFKSGLSTNYIRTGGSTVTQEIDPASPVTYTGAECYKPQANDHDPSSATSSVDGLATTFFFPETANGSTTDVFNRNQSNTSYTLTLPTFTDVSLKDWSTFNGGGSSYTFTTASTDYPGWEMNATTVGGTNANITVTHPTDTTLLVKWYDTWANPDPASYDVYYIDAASGNQYSPLANWNLAGNASGSSTTEGQEISYTINSGIQSGHTYWVRVVPKSSASLTVGFSKSNASAI